MFYLKPKTLNLARLIKDAEFDFIPIQLSDEQSLLIHYKHANYILVIYKWLSVWAFCEATGNSICLRPVEGNIVTSEEQLTNEELELSVIFNGISLRRE